MTTMFCKIKLTAWYVESWMFECGFRVKWFWCILEIVCVCSKYLDSSNMTFLVIYFEHTRGYMYHRGTLTLSHIKKFSDASTADVFWKHCDKSRNCIKLAISPFAIMFSTFYSKYIFNYCDLPYLFLDIFKAICCSFEVCGK